MSLHVGTWVHSGARFTRLLAALEQPFAEDAQLHRVLAVSLLSHASASAKRLQLATTLDQELFSKLKPPGARYITLAQQ